MKFLIFGSTGFVGKQLTDYLLKNGNEVVCISRSGNQNSLKVDISIESDFDKIDFLPDVVVNCASRIPTKNKTSKDPAFLNELFLTNVVGAVNITNWAIKRNVSKIINCSTLVVVKKPWPDPLTESFSSVPDGSHVGYCMSKLAQEQLMSESIKNSSVTKLIHLRLSAVYGRDMPREGIIFNLLNSFIENKEVHLTDATSTTFDFINVIDVCRVINDLSYKQVGNEVVNVASGKPISLDELALILQQLTKSSSVVKNIDTEKPIFKANISIEKMRDLTGNIDHNFISLKEGLHQLYHNL